jgi:hypothetical protein
VRDGSSRALARRRSACDAAADARISAEVRKGCVFVYVELYKVVPGAPFSTGFFFFKRFPGAW